MKLKKVLCMATVLSVLVGSLLTGCGNGSTSSSSNASKASSDSSSTDTSSSTSSLLDTSKFVTVKGIFVGDKGPNSDETIANLNVKFKKDLNCELQGEFISWSDFNTKYPLMFASGEDFDFAYTSSWCFYAQQALKGAFYELKTDDLKNYMPKTYAKVSADQWEQAKINNKIFMIPNTNIQYGLYTKDVFLVRGDLMKKYGMSSIKTTTDMTTYWDNVLKNDPSIIPIAIGNSNNGNEGVTLVNTFVNTPDHAKNTFASPYVEIDCSNPNDIKINDNRSFDISLYKLANEFKNKGYWSKDATTQTDNSITMYENGKSATARQQIGNLNNLYAKLKDKHPEWDSQLVDIRPDIPMRANPAISNGEAIHATSKNPERAMAVIDLLGYDRSYFDLMNSGVEGKDWKENPDGSAKVLNVEFNAALGMGFQTTLVRKAEVRAPNYDSLIDEYKKTAVSPPLSIFNFDTSKLNTQTAAVDSLGATYTTILSLGFDNNVEALYDKMIAEKNKVGLKDIEEEYLKQVKVFMSSYNK